MVRHYSGQRPPPRGNTTSFKQLFWICVAFVLGYLLSAVYDVASFKQWIDATFFAKKIPFPQVVTKAPALPKPKFEFYTLLTKESANAAPVASAVPAVEITAAQPQPQSEAVHPQGGFTVQLAAFNRRGEAEKMKAALTLKGFQVSVVVIEQNHAAWYRVILGPFASKEEAEVAQHAIAERERIHGMIRKASA